MKWFTKLFRKSSRMPRPATRRPSVRLELESLEERMLLSAAGSLGGVGPVGVGPQLPSPQTYTVINTYDTGTGSLRDAITKSDAHGSLAGPNTINFNIPTSEGGIPTIQPQPYALPPITASVIIDATTQPFSHRVELNGANAFSVLPGFPVDGLNITAGGSTVRGMVISGFSANDIELSGQGFNILEGNFLGTDKTGTALAAANSFSNSSPFYVPHDEVFINNSAHNRIGGGAAADRNIISGIDHAGIEISGTAATSNEVWGNYIGTDVSGTHSLGYSASAAQVYQGTGVLVSGSGNVIGDSSFVDMNGKLAGSGNLISGNGTGVSFFGSGNDLLGNFIGTDVTGTASLGNVDAGVVVEFGVSNNYIGGGERLGLSQTLFDGNLISGNFGDGVDVNGDGNFVQDNFIGTDINGEAALRNDHYGVSVASNNLIGGTVTNGQNVISGNYVADVYIAGTGNKVSGNNIGTDKNGVVAISPVHNTIGVEIDGGSGNHLGTYLDSQGNLAGAGNVISGHNDGVFVQTAGQNQIQGNFIGTDYLGTGVIGNGIGVQIDSSNTLIGGTTPGLANVISGNGNGSEIDAGGPIVSNDNGIHQNSIFGNVGHGIFFLSGQENNSQTAPTLLSAVANANSVTVKFKVTTTTAGTYTIEFFANAASDPNEGKTYLGTDTVTNRNANTTFTRTFTIANVTVLPGQYITATATAQGTAAIPHDNTSRFSNGQVVPVGNQGMSHTQGPLVINISSADGYSIRQAGTFAWFVRQDYSLVFAGSYYQNSLGLNEKWIKTSNAAGNQFGNLWYYILPNGDFYAWNNGTSNGGQSRYLTTLDPIYWAFPAMLHNASQDTFAVAIQQVLNLQRDALNPDGTEVDYNYLGRGERWLKGATNNNNNPWYFITPDGNFYAWDGASGFLLTTLDPIYFNQLERLTQAVPNPANTPNAVDAQVTQPPTPNPSTLTLTLKSAAYVGNWVVELTTIDVGVANTVERFTVKVDNQPVTLTAPIPDQSITNAQLKSGVAVNLPLAGADTNDTLFVTGKAVHQGYIVQTANGLYAEDPSYATVSEKWLMGNPTPNNPKGWYALTLISGVAQIYAWNGVDNTSGASNPATTLDNPLYFYLPDLLYKTTAIDFGAALNKHLENGTNYENSSGTLHERWFIDSFGNYFYMTPGDGNVFQRIHGEPNLDHVVATLDPSYYNALAATPQDLAPTFPMFTVAINAANTQATISVASHYSTFGNAEAGGADFWVQIEASDMAQPNYGRKVSQFFKVHVQE